ncbi:MAG: MFS transporter [Candidatus Latescibacteria bacterium]|nr:MFS transporter [Candidatus Latescibacterota bacterium]
MTDQPTPLTRGQVTRGLRAFITASGLWGAWSQAAGLGTAVFTGYALLLGADASFISLITSMAYLLAITQLVAVPLGARVADKKRFIIGTGIGEILLRGSPILIPVFLAPSLHLGALVLLVGLSLLCGYIISPFYNTWNANTIPANIRARFASRKTIISTLVAMVAGFLIGQFLDLFPQDDKQQAFTYVFAVGTLFGLLGYLGLQRATYPTDPPPPQDQQSSLTMLVRPLRDRRFRRAALFFGTWTFSIGLTGPLYSVFMIKHLGISYTEISIFNALFMLCSIFGNRLWANLVDRFGSKPVLQIILLPAALLPIIWIFNQPDSYYLVPVALVLTGLLFSGINVSTTPLLYGLLPQGAQRTYYLASWSTTVNLLGAMGPLAGGLLVAYLSETSLTLGGLELGHLKLIFLLSVVVRIAPLILLRFVDDSGTVSSRQLLSQLLRGNVLSYALNAALYHGTTEAQRRAQAALGLGKSGNPLAVEQLIQALADASPKVRRSAARALGETGSEAATAPLVEQLLDDESDIRSEAAEALGRLGHPRSVDPLVDALADPDPRIRISAIRGLASIPGDEVQELLFWHLHEQFDPLTFPTLVDALSERGDQRIVQPALKRLDRFRAPAIRLQLLNSVCRALGAGDQFYRLLSYEDTRRNAAIGRLLSRTAASMQKTKSLPRTAHQDLKVAFNQLIQAYEEEQVDQLHIHTLEISARVRDELSTGQTPPATILPIFVALMAINTFLHSPHRQDLPEAQDIFLAVMLRRLATLVEQTES